MVWNVEGTDEFAGQRGLDRMSRFRRLRQERLADPDFRAAVAVEKTKMLLIDLDLASPRRAAGLTQAQVAARMGTTQENVSRIERQRDMLISTLASLIQAEGGQLEIEAIFGDERINLMKPVRG